MKKLLFFFILIPLYSISQNTILLNSTTHNTSGQYCGYWFYDDGGSSANYSNNQDFGFNGQEKDDEIFGSTGTSYTAEFWQYDSRIGRRWNVDPKPNPAISYYATFANNPIWHLDPLGDTIRIKYRDPDKFLGGIFKSKYTYVPGEEYKGDNEFVSKVVQSLNNDRGLDDNKIIDNLSSSKKNIRITETKNENSSYTSLIRTVRWNPNMAMSLYEYSPENSTKRKDAFKLTGESISSSTVLFHELGHGYSHFFDKLNYFNRGNITIKHWTNEEEKFNITKFEHPLAKKKGEGIRNNHYGKYFKVSGVFEH